MAQSTGWPLWLRAMDLASYCSDVCCDSPVGAVIPSSHPQSPGILGKAGAPVYRASFPTCPLQLSLGSLSFLRLLLRRSVWSLTLEGRWPLSPFTSHEISPHLERDLLFSLLWDTWHDFFREFKLSQKTGKAFDIKFSVAQNPWGKQSIRMLEMRGWKNTVLRINYLLKYYPVCSFLHE